MQQGSVANHVGRVLPPACPRAFRLPARMSSRPSPRPPHTHPSYAGTTTCKQRRQRRKHRATWPVQLSLPWVARVRGVAGLWPGRCWPAPPCACSPPLLDAHSAQILALKAACMGEPSSPSMHRCAGLGLSTHDALHQAAEQRTDLSTSLRRFSIVQATCWIDRSSPP